MHPGFRPPGPRQPASRWWRGRDPHQAGGNGMLDTLGEVLPASARRFRDKTALVVGDRKFSFSELNELSSRLANSLRGIGVEAGDRITLYAPNSWEWVVSYYAIHELGAVANPINAMLTPEEGRLRRRGLRGEGAHRLAREGRAAARAARQWRGEPPAATRVPAEAGGFARSSSSATALRRPARAPSTSCSPRGARTCRSPRCRPTRSRPSATPRAPPDIPRERCTATGTSS